MINGLDVFVADRMPFRFTQNGILLSKVYERLYQFARGLYCLTPQREPLEHCQPAPVVTTGVIKRRWPNCSGPTLRRRGEECAEFPVFYAVFVF